MAREVTVATPRVAVSNSTIPEAPRVDMIEFFDSDGYSWLMGELKRLHQSRQRVAFDQPQAMETGNLRLYNIGMAVGVEMVVSYLERVFQEAKESA